ncbi:pyrroline-5-carboxylate reductase family protein, partial [Flavonifractor plautii]|uniref:pyrroline-5-carboxylate reductase family protein n=1 Tax=Flavonifractor plautii TaxID=292800 RepID=UPI001FA6D3E1
MGAPLIQAACRAVGAEQVVIANRTRAKAEALAAELGCAVAQDNRAAAAQAEYIVLCVKPQMMEGVLSELAPALGEGQAVVSIAAGLTCGTLRGGWRGAGAACPPAGHAQHPRRHRKGDAGPVRRGGHGGGVSGRSGGPSGPRRAGGAHRRGA